MFFFCSLIILYMCKVHSGDYQLILSPSYLYSFPYQIVIFTLYMYMYIFVYMYIFDTHTHIYLRPKEFNQDHLSDHKIWRINGG